MSGPTGSRVWLHVRVEGRVQGVGFRRFVERAAQTLGLSGWVRNLADGSVEVSATGDAGAIARLRERLAAGPPHAQVGRLVEVAGGSEPRGAGFQVLTRDAVPEDE
jgi:acylphosphatase